VNGMLKTGVLEPCAAGAVDGRWWAAEKRACILLVLLDLLASSLSVMAAFWLLPHSAPDNALLLLSPVLLMGGVYVVGGYDLRTDFRRLDYFSEHLIAVAGAGAVLTLFTYLVSSYHETAKPSRLFIPALASVFLVATLIARRRLGQVWRRKRASEWILVLGSGERVQRFRKDYESAGLEWRLRFVSPVLGVNPDGLQDEFLPCVEGGVLEVLESGVVGCRMVVLACRMEELGPALVERLAELHCGQTPVLTVPAFYEEQWRRVEIGGVEPEWLFECEFRLAQGAPFSQLKRIFDVVFSLCALVVLAPVLLVLGFLVVLDSPGGALFRQERTGLRGRSFTVYKLRTMVAGGGDVYTRRGDARVTRVGRWLRETRLDELPQLLNVLRGEMSLIGPRAEWVRCVEEYAKTIPHYHLRHLVRPGITGWAQVNYGYGEGREDAVAKFQYDLYYLRYFSLKLDVSILVKTVYTMLARRGR
jgi:exopolysaccharide biosynthesis polyprenyl glycosylphosphotransferase